MSAFNRSPERLEWLRSPENLARLAAVGQSPENLARLASRNQSPAHLAMLAAHSRSPENLARLAEFRRSPEIRDRIREWLADYNRSPEARERSRQLMKMFWSVPRAGALHELFDAPDPDWCDQHGVSFYDHTSAQQRQKCYLSWDAREEESG